MPLHSACTALYEVRFVWPTIMQGVFVYQNTCVASVIATPSPRETVEKACRDVILETSSGNNNAAHTCSKLGFDIPPTSFFLMASPPCPLLLPCQRFAAGHLTNRPTSMDGCCRVRGLGTSSGACKVSLCPSRRLEDEGQAHHEIPRLNGMLSVCSFIIL